MFTERKKYINYSILFVMAAYLRSVHSISSGKSDTECWDVATEKDTSNGLGLITDRSCTSRAIGCISDICRYCKMFDSPESKGLNDCPPLGQQIVAGIPIEDPIIYTTKAPAQTPSKVVPHTPVAGSSDEPATSTQPMLDTQDCDIMLSKGDREAGVNIITDSTCHENPGVGCFAKKCRFCRVFYTKKSAHFPLCSDFSTSSQSLDNSGKDDIQSSSSNGEKKNDDMVSVRSALFVHGGPKFVAQFQAGNICSLQVNPADINVGVSALVDNTCARSDDEDCFSDSCRYCKVRQTIESSRLQPCDPSQMILDDRNTEPGDNPTANMDSNDLHANESLDNMDLDGHDDDLGNNHGNHHNDKSENEIPLSLVTTESGDNKDSHHPITMNSNEESDKSTKISIFVVTGLLSVCIVLLGFVFRYLWVARRESRMSLADKSPIQNTNAKELVTPVKVVNLENLYDL